MHVPKLFTILSHLEKRRVEFMGKGVKGAVVPGNDAEMLLDGLVSSRSNWTALDRQMIFNSGIFQQDRSKYVSNLLSTLLNWTKIGSFYNR
ncbi:MAG: hypothetical protein IPK46_18245 [Saprospiraceae bacterium]|nr:hypothetical protein [Saprospiraceae bacterium]